MTTASFVIDARTFEPRPPAAGGCRYCGNPNLETGPAPHYCSLAHRKDAYRARRAGTPLAAEPGRCWCGAELPEPPVLAFCSRRCREAWQVARRYRAFQAFQALVKWPHELGWLGPKLGLPPDDPRLPEIALKLAGAGRLVVYVRRDGTVGEVGRPKPPRRRLDSRRRTDVR